MPWNATIGDREKDKHLPDKLRKEWPGILAWAVRGCLEWQRDGLKEPRRVSEATTTYQKEQDVFQDFIDECCEVNLAARVLLSDLLEAYQQWTGDKAMTNKELSKKLKELNYEAKRGSTGVIYRGIGLEEAEPEAEPVEAGNVGSVEFLNLLYGDDPGKVRKLLHNLH